MFVVTIKFGGNEANASVQRAGRRRTSPLVSFRTKLLSHGDGKAMSRLYNSRTHSYRHPMHKHERELPSSLNKRTPTQARSNTVYPLSRDAGKRQQYQQSI